MKEKQLSEFAGKLGVLLEWEFGHVLNLKLESNPSNHIFDSGKVELHWDGAFVDENPRFNVFQCLQGCSDGKGGETVFVNSVKLLESMEKKEVSHWEHINITYHADKKAHYGGTISEKLISDHPVTQKKRIRFIEPFNEDNKDVNPVSLRVDGYSEHNAQRVFSYVTEKLYQEDYLYAHKWEAGDLLIIDNHALLHGRRKFLDKNVSRHLQRIHVL